MGERRDDSCVVLFPLFFPFVLLYIYNIICTVLDFLYIFSRWHYSNRPTSFADEERPALSHIIYIMLVIILIWMG